MQKTAQNITVNTVVVTHLTTKAVQASFGFPVTTNSEHIKACIMPMKETGQAYSQVRRPR